MSSSEHLVASEQRRSAEPSAVPVNEGGRGIIAIGSASVRSGSRAKLREARFDDYRSIAALESRFDLAIKPHREWLHLWQGNPLYRELKSSWPIGWVLEDEDGRIVGSMGNIPLLYQLGGKRIIGATGRHWVAEPAHRSKSILLLERLITQPNIDLYVNTTVSRASLPAVIALGCSRMPVGVWDEAGYWIPSYWGCLRSVVATKNPFAISFWRGSWAHSKAMGRELFKLNSVVSALKDRTRDTAARKNDLRVVACSDFDDRFDGFWEDLKNNNRQLLLAVRSREFLSWHFKYALLANRLWIATIMDGPKLIAYAIFLKAIRPYCGLKQVKQVDYVSLDGGATMLEPLISWALERCRTEGIDLLEHTGRWLGDEVFFGKRAPYRRKLPSWQYFYRVNNSELKQQLGVKNAWAPSLYDGDATL